MARFKNIKQIQEEFECKRVGLTVPYHESVRYEDIERNAETIQYLLESDYNTISGWEFGQLLEAVSHFNSNCDFVDYKNKSGINESFAGTLQALTPTPILNQGLVSYQYTNSVLPYLVYMFDMKGSNRAYAYYAKLKANKTVGTTTSGDTLADVKSIGNQTTDYIGTRVDNKEVATTVSGDSTYTLNLGFAPIKPQTLIITIDGVTGSLKDMTSGSTGGTAYLTNIDGNVGTAVADLDAGTVELTLTNAPTQTGVSIKASYNRDVETVDADTNNLAEVVPEIEAVDLQAEDFSVKTKLTLQQERAFASIFGGNWNSVVEDMLGYIYNREIANRVTKDIKDNLDSGSIITHDVTSTTNTGDNRLFNAKFIDYPIRKLNSVITKQSGIPVSKSSTYVVNQETLPILQGHSKFKGVDANEENMDGMYLAGSFDGIPVVATPENTILTSGEIMTLFKSKKQQFLTPAVFGNFILPVVRSVYDYRNMSMNHKQLIASAATKVVAEKLASKLTLNGINTII